MTCLQWNIGGHVNTEFKDTFVTSVMKLNRFGHIPLPNIPEMNFHHEKYHLSHDVFEKLADPNNVVSVILLYTICDVNRNHFLQYDNGNRLRCVEN